MAGTRPGTWLNGYLTSVIVSYPRYECNYAIGVRLEWDGRSIIRWILLKEDKIMRDRVPVINIESFDERERFEGASC